MEINGHNEKQISKAISKASKSIETPITSAVVSPNKAVLKNSEDSDGIRVKSPISLGLTVVDNPNAARLLTTESKVGSFFILIFF